MSSSNSLHSGHAIIRATRTQEVLGEKGRRIRELTALVQKRFKFPENSLELYAEKFQYRGLSAITQCESLRYKLLGVLAVRRACYGVLRFVLESSTKGCDVVVSGKLHTAHAKSTHGFMIRSGQPAVDFVVCHVLLRQGVFGIKVKLERIRTQNCPTTLEPFADKTVTEPTSEQREPIAVAPPLVEVEETSAPQDYQQ
ncbi:hypothetical protein B0H11DRAFT_2308210 [Mycena galericulata]|nr:hypothetical protein B0H11DRAFT_2308210 [Mycena galericulata]